MAGSTLDTDNFPAGKKRAKTQRGKTVEQEARGQADLVKTRKP
ncbi:MAG TPA: hypothetical protein VJ834_01925 [Burkholderiales bacterium]|nr:hypothetical protein [Burkholderiales bacterium]